MNNKTNLYPLKFYPILKEKVWGGSKLESLLHKVKGENIGESWELSGIEENISVVSNGALQGKQLSKLIEFYKGDLLGEKVFQHFGNKFPLLFKFIDAQQDLSVQLHPDDTLAQKRHNSFGKTEMWYILQAEKNSRLILGFNQEMDKPTYLKYLSENKITDILHSEKVSEGDAFFIAPGTVHAIGGGVMLAEIQQTSDITYRIYDWDRPGTDGKLRELHTDLAIEAINFTHNNTELSYTDKINEIVQLCCVPYFEANKLHLTKSLKRNLSKIDSFVVYMCVEGNAVFEYEGLSEKINKGETLLLPACLTSFTIKTNKATFLEVYIP